jgi:L-lysine 2,3-aminomutase
MIAAASFKRTSEPGFRMTKPDILPAEPARPPRWQQILREAVRDWPTLAAVLELPVDGCDAFTPAQGQFPLLAPRGFIARMRKRDPRDPLLVQVLPRRAERSAAAGFVADPLGELAVAHAGMLSKYPGRVLLVTTASCPVHCRYCFRRAFPYADVLAAREDFAPALAALARAPDVSEVILSGGDPLSLANGRLARLLEQLAGIPSLRTVRIHTRFPIMIPERVDDALCAILDRSPLLTVVVVHANHPNEIDAAVGAALERLRRSCDAVLNQSVLLAQVNDDAATLADLSHALIAHGVLPYYLHMLDRVSGAQQFEVDHDRAVALHAALRQRLPGYLLPRLVREQPGELSKTPVS